MCVWGEPKIKKPPPFFIAPLPLNFLHFTPGPTKHTDDGDVCLLLVWLHSKRATACSAYTIIARTTIHISALYAAALWAGGGIHRHSHIRAQCTTHTHTAPRWHFFSTGETCTMTLILDFLAFCGCHSSLFGYVVIVMLLLPLCVRTFPLCFPFFLKGEHTLDGGSGWSGARASYNATPRAVRCRELRRRA